MRFAISKKYLTILVVSTLMIFSCKKKDETPPMVDFILPSEGAIYNVYDTVHTRFTASDETGLHHVFAQILDENFIPIAASETVNISSSTSQGSAELVIEDKLLETGSYYVLASASDGKNETREFREIRIIALPKKRRAIFASTQGQSDLIWKIDSLFQTGNQWLQPSQDILKLCVNSQQDRLTIIGNLSTGIRSFDISSTGIVWSDDAINVNQIQRYTDIFCFNSVIYCGLFDRELRSYSLNGSLTLNELTGNYRPETFYADETYLVVGMKLIGGNSHHIFVYHRQTNSLLWQQEIPMEIKAICALQNDEVLLFGNSGNQARVLHYDIGNNGYWEPRQLPVGKLSDAIKMEALNFAIAHESGLYTYTYNPNFLNQIGTLNYQDICFDVDNGTLVGAAQNLIEEIHPVNGSLINSFSQGDSITSIDIHYTR